MHSLSYRPNYKLDILQIGLFSICFLVVTPFLAIMPERDLNGWRARLAEWTIDHVGGAVTHLSCAAIDLRDRHWPNLLQV